MGGEKQDGVQGRSAGAGVWRASTGKTGQSLPYPLIASPTPEKENTSYGR